jgi:protein-tyrosine phosphatase
MIDIHAHILPGIDDGADTIETSLEMLKIAEEDGIKRIIATPHYYTGHFETDYKEVVKLVKDLTITAQENNINIEILPGQEVFLDNNTINQYKSEIISTINNSKYMLVELPFNEIPSYTFDMIYELRVQGITPIVAHPERYSYIVNKPSTINQFIDEGCLFQITSGSIMGMFGKSVQKTAETLITHRICHFVASDAHTINKRCPKVKKSFDTISVLDKELFDMLTNNVECCLKNTDIKQGLQKIKARTSIFDIFKKIR